MLLKTAMPTQRLPVITDIKERLEAFSMPEPNSGCWIWIGSMRADGYCKTNYRGRDAFAHRVSWESHRGEIPEGMSVLHRCDVRCCVNPDHLFLGSQQDNMDDMVAKGRHVVGKQPKGGRSHRAKLTQAAAEEILLSSQSGVELAKRFGVSRGCVSQVRRGVSWKHLRSQ